METGRLDVIAEISVALAGFSGLAGAFRHRRFSEWTRRERLALWQILNWSVLTLFLALVPSALLNLRIPEEATWRLMSAIAFIAITIYAAALLIWSRRLTRSGEPAKGWAYPLNSVVGVFSAIGLLTNATLVARPGIGLYQLALLGTLFIATMSFVNFLTYRDAAFYEGESVKRSSSDEASGD